MAAPSEKCVDIEEKLKPLHEEIKLLREEVYSLRAQLATAYARWPPRCPDFPSASANPDLYNRSPFSPAQRPIFNPIPPPPFGSGGSSCFGDSSANPFFGVTRSTQLFGSSTTTPLFNPNAGAQLFNPTGPASLFNVGSCYNAGHY